VLLRLLDQAEGVLSEGELMCLRRKVEVLIMDVLCERGGVVEEGEGDSGNISDQPSLSEINLWLAKVKVQLALGKVSARHTGEPRLTSSLFRVQSASQRCCMSWTDFSLPPVTVTRTTIVMDTAHKACSLLPELNCCQQKFCFIPRLRLLKFLPPCQCCHGNQRLWS